MPTITKTPGKTGHADECCCTVCRGLTTFERPLFATGQTLSAADLTALQSYVAGKNRLHNRFLHGWGVVCGLEVVCDDCEGSVTIRPGYAIDPCGADIVVGQPVRFDVIRAIQDCSGAGRTRTGDCDPWMPPPDPGCRDALSHWCIALNYREIETAIGQRLTTGGAACVTLGKGGGASHGGCGCGGGCGGGGGCNCTPAATVNAPPLSSVTASNSCAPRRVMECFDVSLVKSAEACAPTFGRFMRGTKSEANPLGIFDSLIPKRTLLRKIIDCIINDFKALQARMTNNELVIVLFMAFSNSINPSAPGIDLGAIHAAICKFRGAVLDLLAGDDHPTRCQLRRAVAEITLRAPTNDDAETDAARAAWIELAQEAARELVAAWLQLILDCICHAFLPQCGEDPCDERLEIACVTVKAGKILSICNHSCRRYAGAFPSTVYWMSLIPILPLISRILVMICCQPDLLRRNSPLVNDLVPLLRTVDPTGRMAERIVADQFALPRRYLTALSRLADIPLLPALIARLNSAVLGGTKGDGGIKDRDPAVPDAPATRVEVGIETAALREEIATLRKEMATLRTAAPTPPSPKTPVRGATATKPRRKGG